MSDKDEFDLDGDLPTRRNSVLNSDVRNVIYRNMHQTSYSCQDIPGSLLPANSSASISSTHSRRSNIPAPLVCMGYERSSTPSRIQIRRQPLCATGAYPRNVVNNSWQRKSSSPVAFEESPLEVHKRANGFQEQGHTPLSFNTSWSPTQNRQKQASRFRTCSNSQDRQQKRRSLSRSTRMRNWIQSKQNSACEDNMQSTFYSINEKKEDLCTEYHDEPVETKDFKSLRKRKSRRISARRKRNWVTDLDRGISPESEASETDIEEATNIEKRLLELSSGWTPQEVRDHRICALRSLLTTKNQPLTVLNLLEANKIADAVASAMENNNKVRLDVCLLWACLQGSADLVSSLLGAGANVDAKDSTGFSGLHLAAESGSEEVIKKLIIHKAKVGRSEDWDYNQEVTPIMLAAKSKCIGGVKSLIKAGADVNAGLNSGKETALHYAVHTGIPESVQLLLNAGASPNSTVLYSETPLHIATYEGLQNIVDILLTAGADVKASRGASKMTALHIAAFEGYSSITHQLLKAGADPNQENLRGQTALHLAARSQSYDTVQVLLSFGADPNVCDRDHKTPLHTGIFKGSGSHECLRLLLEAGADTNVADLAGYTPLHMAALHDSSYCVLLFLEHGGDLTASTQGGISALNLILRRTPTVLTYIQESLDAAISFTDHDRQDTEAQVQMNFRVLVPGEGFGLECRMLSCFIQEGQKALLKHPLCETLLLLKWLKVRSFFILNLVFYGLLIIMLTVYILVVFPAASCFQLNSTAHETNVTSVKFSTPEHLETKDTPTTPILTATRGLDVANITNSVSTPIIGSNSANINIFNGDMMSEENAEKRDACGLKNESHLLNLLYVIWLFLSVLAAKEVFQIVDMPRTYFRAWENMLVWPVIIFTMVITIESYVKHDTEPWEHHLAAIVILISWVKLLLLIGRFPVFGLYIQMFTQVTKNFGKFVLAYLSLILAFSLSFGVLFPNHPPFKVYMMCLLKTVVMMTGEIEFNEIFFNDETTVMENIKSDEFMSYGSIVMYPGTSHIIFAIFLIFVTIILMNLLVGLAVSDIQGLQKSAGLDRLVRESQQIAQFEAIMFSKWLAWVMPERSLRFLHQGILICPSLYGWTLVLTPKTLSDTGLPAELVEVILRTARTRDNKTRRRNAFANFRSLSKTAQYSGDDGDVQQTLDALRFGLDLLVWDTDERHEESSFMRETLTALREDIERIRDQIDVAVCRKVCHDCEIEPTPSKDNGIVRKNTSEQNLEYSKSPTGPGTAQSHSSSNEA